MLSENMKAVRKSKGLSQEELAVKLNVVIVVIFVLLILVKSPYLGWDYSEPEIAVLGVGVHSLEWLFVRLASFTLVVQLLV